MPSDKEVLSQTLDLKKLYEGWRSKKAELEATKAEPSPVTIKAKENPEGELINFGEIDIAVESEQLRASVMDALAKEGCSRDSAALEAFGCGLTELIKNTIDALVQLETMDETRPDNVMKQLEVSAVLKDGKVLIIVEDHGPGFITEDQASEGLIPYKKYRSETECSKTKTIALGGRGLGLARINEYLTLNGFELKIGRRMDGLPGARLEICSSVEKALFPFAELQDERQRESNVPNIVKYDLNFPGMFARKLPYPITEGLPQNMRPCENLI